MADIQPAPRRYLTRAQAKQDHSATAATASSTARRRVPIKRKALGEASTNSENVETFSLSTKTTRAAKKTAIQSTALSVAPKRRSKRTDAPSAERKIKTMMKSSKKVSFASPVIDKENAIPAITIQGEKPVKEAKDQCLDNADVLSESISALSVRPKRAKVSIVKPPTALLADETQPILSPKRPKRFNMTSELKRISSGETSEDELATALTSPGLSRKPKRLPRVAKDAMEGAGLLAPQPLKASGIFGSPARRIAPSPFKSRKETSEPSSMRQSVLASPAKRSAKIASTLKQAGTVKRNPSQLKISITNQNAIDPFSEPKAESSEDELSMPSTRRVDRKLFMKREAIPGKTLVADFGFQNVKEEVKVESKAEPKSEDIVEDEILHDRSLTPPFEPSEDAVKFINSLTPKPEDIVLSVHIDEDGDVAMVDLNEQNTSPTPAAQQSIKKKLRSPSEGGSSYGFFGISDDEDDDGVVDENCENTAPKQQYLSAQPQGTAVVSLADKFGGIELDRQRRRSGGRSFGQALSVSPPPEHLAIDPLLLSADTMSGVEPQPNSISRMMMVPVKLPPEDSDTEQDDSSKGRRRSSTGSGSRRSRRSSGMFQPLAGVLSGAVVFVDVHTEDGADASKTFEDMLRSLGARVLKQWNWNLAFSSPSQAGITHAVFKEGSPRTLQKVKDAQGKVICVGVSWVATCAAEGRWADESDFAVDLEIIPRGGHRRRKSMEPKAMKSKSPSPPPTAPITPPTKMSLSIPVPRTEPGLSLLNERIMVARRKSMQFAPKIGSPLARGAWTATES